ncbi:hypothetical protein [Alcaligenes sp. WGS1538]|uniref:hypothetical protein n=1 Tax=Alcaligenes sp. WGS1538 TaxID=3366811 RepID=UPI00372D4B24
MLLLRQPQLFYSLEKSERRAEKVIRISVFVMVNAEIEIMRLVISRCLCGRRYWNRHPVYFKGKVFRSIGIIIIRIFWQSGISEEDMGYKLIKRIKNALSAMLKSQEKKRVANNLIMRPNVKNAPACCGAFFFVLGAKAPPRAKAGLAWQLRVLC